MMRGSPEATLRSNHCSPDGCTCGLSVARDGYDQWGLDKDGYDRQVSLCHAVGIACMASCPTLCGQSAHGGLQPSFEQEVRVVTCFAVATLFLHVAVVQGFDKYGFDREGYDRYASSRVFIDCVCGNPSGTEAFLGQFSDSKSTQ